MQRRPLAARVFSVAVAAIVVFDSSSPKAAVGGPTAADFADLAESLGTSIGGLLALPIKNILKDAEERIGRLIADVDNRARVAVVGATNSATLLLNQARSTLSDVLDKTFGQLDDQRKALVMDMLSTIKAAERSADNVVVNTSIDLTRFANHVAFWAPKVRFLIERIAPAIVVAEPEKATYSVTLRGIGIGTDEGSVHYSEQFYIGDQLVPPSNYARYPAALRVDVPAEMLRSYFSAGKPTIVPARIVSDITEDGFLRSKKKQHVANFDLTIYPTTAATLTLEQMVQTPTLVDDGSPPKILTVVTKSGHPHGAHMPTTMGPAVADAGHQFVVQGTACGSYMTCQGKDDSCKFFVSCTCNFDSNNTIASCTSVTSSHALTLTYTFNQRKVSSKPVPVPLTKYDLTFGSAVPVQYRTDASQVRLYGKMASGERIDTVLVPPGGGSDGWITCASAAPIGDGLSRAICRLRPLP